MNNISLLRAAFVVLLFAGAGFGKKPLEYKIVIDPKDLSDVKIEMLIPDAGGSVRLAMAAHPEYDDRYFRYVENFAAESAGRSLSAAMPEPAVWQVDGIRGPLKVSYRVVPPPKEREWRQTWKPFLTPTGGMVGDLHMLMYIVGGEAKPARLTLEMPDGWSAASGLEPTRDPLTFAGTVEDLLDAPVIVGKFDEWKFEAGGVPHQVVIWSPTDGKAIVPKPIVDGIKRLADESIRAFGKPPYERYAFLLENGGSAALEHKTSLNAGIADELADTFDNIAHEYVHVWNLMDVRPRERVGVRYKFAEPTGVLWWSEGATIMFADMLTRRIGIPTEFPARVNRVESLLARYYSSPGYRNLSAEAVSRTDSHPDLLSDDFASTHLQGEVLVTLLDLMVRDRTDNRRNAADVMRLLAKRFDSRRGIDNGDIEKAVADTCGCDVSPFFRDHIFNARSIDLNRYLSLAGLRAEVEQIPSMDDRGRPLVDLRIGPLSTEGEFKVRIMNSESTWAKAGIRTGDRVVSADGRPITTWSDFRGWLQGLQIGDTAKIIIRRDGADRTLEVPIRGFERASVKISQIDGATPRQQRIRDAWATAR
jgi:predicted metalloprotease with PDZ domain